MASAPVYDVKRGGEFFNYLNFKLMVLEKESGAGVPSGEPELLDVQGVSGFLEQIGQNTPFQPPPAGADGANKTLPIVSLIFGCVSLCCYISPLTGLVALITGYMAMKNINADPATYGGKGLAIAGMITGGIFFLLGILYWIYIIFIIGLSAMGSMGGLG